MATAVEGLYMNPQGWIPIANKTVTALSTDGYTEGTDTTDANGHFRITGLTDRNWLAKVSEGVDDVGVFVLVPVTLLHGNLQEVDADQHHLGFTGLIDSSGTILVPDVDDKIQIVDDGKVNADQGSTVSTLSLSIDESQVTHGSLGSLGGDDHTQYVSGGGRVGGQGVFGGTGTGEDLTLAGTAHGTPGSVIIGTSSIFEMDENTGQLKLPTSGSSAGVLLGGDALLYRVSADLLRTPDALTVDGAAILSTSLDIAASTVVSSILDEDTLSSDSATALSTQQSIKAYVDATAGHDAVTAADSGHTISTQALSSAAATTSLSAHVELATTAEIDTGTDAIKAMVPSLFVASDRNIRFITIRLIDVDTDVATETSVGGDWVCPFTGTLIQDDTSKGYCSANVDTAGTTGDTIIDVHKGGTTVMTTNKLDIETTEKSTIDAATQPDLTTTAVTAGDIFTFDVDTAQTTKAKGLSVTLAIRLT